MLPHVGTRTEQAELLGAEKDKAKAERQVELCRVRASSSSTATPEALSCAPGVPAESTCAERITSRSRFPSRAVATRLALTILSASSKKVNDSMRTSRPITLRAFST